MANPHDHLIGQVIDKANADFDGIPSTLNGEIFGGGSVTKGWLSRPPIQATPQEEFDDRIDGDPVLKVLVDEMEALSPGFRASARARVV